MVVTRGVVANTALDCTRGETQRVTGNKFNIRWSKWSVRNYSYSSLRAPFYN